MPHVPFIVRSLVIGCTVLCLQACGKSDSGSNAGSSSGTGAPAASGSGFSGTYTSVDSDPLTMEFKSGGSVVMSMEGIGESTGTYTVDGEKIIVSIDNQKHTFIRDGNCIEEGRNIFGRLCKGGKAGELTAAAVTPIGTYVAKNEDGEFKIEFKPGNKLTLSMMPKVGKPEVLEGRYEVEGRMYFIILPLGNQMVFTYVNDTFEGSVMGLATKFVKQ